MKYKVFSTLLLIFSFSYLYPQSTYFIKYKESVSKSEIHSKLINGSFIPAKTNLRINAVVKSAEYLAKGIAKDDDIIGRIIKITFANNVEETTFLQLKNIDPTIEYIQKANIYKTDFVPNDFSLSEQWALKKIKAFDAWNVTTGSDTVLLAIIDTGIDYLHPDLQNKIFINPGENGIDGEAKDKRFNGIDDDGNGFIDDYRGWDFVDRVGFPFDTSVGDYLSWDNNPLDDNGHGTFVAGIAGAETNNEIGIAGVAPNIRLLNIRSFDTGGYGEEDDAAAAILYAVQMGCKVINMSWGDNSFSYVLRDVIRYAHSKGVVLVGSAGNNGSNVPHYPSGYSEVICVGNSTVDDYVASNSNFGSTIDLVAPGTSIFSTSLHSEYKNGSGTSAATPHVSGAAALILSLRDLTNEEVRQILKSTTDDIDEPGWDLRSGAGRLNLFRAVSVVAPSVIKINNPTQDFATFNNQLIVNATVLSAYFQNYSLYYGTGLNPTDWITLIKNGLQQFADEDIYTLDLSTLPENVYCLRLVVNLTSGRTSEERVNFYIIRTPPEVTEIESGLLYYGNKSTIGGEFETDQLSVMRLYYRKFGDTNFNYITLDGFNTNNQFVKQSHYGFIPKDIVQPGTLYEVYFEAENLVGLKTAVLDTLNNLNYFHYMTDNPPEIASYNKMSFSLPKGYLYSHPVSFLSDNYDEVLFQTFYETPDYIFGLFHYQNNNFAKIDSLQGKSPSLFGDFNNNGKKDFISFLTPNLFIDEQAEAQTFSLVNKLTNNENNFPLIADDLNSDGNYELITLTQDKNLVKWNINSNLTISDADTFYSVSKDTSDPEPGYSESNYPTSNVGIADINNDSNKEIWVLDADGDLKSYIVEPSGSLTKGISYVTHGLTTWDKNILSIGDYNGDGIKDFAILYLTNSIAPTFLLLILTYRNNNFEILTQKFFLDQSAEFAGFGFNRVYQSLKFADVDNDNVDELILNIFPHTYILKYDQLGDKFIFFLDGVNTADVFADDLNGNGIIDVAYQFSDRYKFYEFGPATRPETPTILNAYSNNSLQAELNWVWRTNQYYIYKGTSPDPDSLLLYDSVFTNSYLDSNVQELITYYYAIQAYDPIKPDPSSILSSLAEIYIHHPAQVETVYGSSTRTIIVKFSEKMNNTVENLQAFELVNVGFPNSISTASQYSYLLTFRQSIPVGNNQLLIKGLKDFYRSPVPDTTIQFQMDSTIIAQEFYISSFKVENPYLVKVIFNLDVDETSVLSTSNYSFEPDNRVSSIHVDDSNKKVIYLNLEGQKPVGSIGKEYVLRLESVRSSLETGNIKINSGAGSYIVLTGFTQDLSDVYVYPNPVKIGNGESKLTFANLPQYAKITIWNLDGIKVGEIDESDGNGGADYNLKNLSGEFLGSGIYIYRVVMLDESKNEGKEKIGKFAVIR